MENFSGLPTASEDAAGGAQNPPPPESSSLPQPPQNAAGAPQPPQNQAVSGAPQPPDNQQAGGHGGHADDAGSSTAPVKATAHLSAVKEAMRKAGELAAPVARWGARRRAARGPPPPSAAARASPPGAALCRSHGTRLSSYEREGAGNEGW